VLYAVRIAAYGFSTEDLFSYIKTGVAGIDAMQCALLENYVYIWGIDRGGWLKPFSGHPDGFGVEVTPQSQSRLCEINSVREKIISPLLNLKRRLEAGNAQSSCRAVYEFMVEINASENLLAYAQFLYENKNEAGAVECSQVWDTLISSLDALYDAVSVKNDVGRCGIVQFYGISFFCIRHSYGIGRGFCHFPETFSVRNGVVYAEISLCVSAELPGCSCNAYSIDRYLDLCVWKAIGYPLICPGHE
jgi:hypothetical protein